MQWPAGGRRGGGAEWTIVQEGALLTITPDGGTCGALIADVSGTRAEIRAKTCAAGAIESGKLTLEPSTSLGISITSISPLAMGSCSRVTTGTLSR